MCPDCENREQANLKTVETIVENMFYWDEPQETELTEEEILLSLSFIESPPEILRLSYNPKQWREKCTEFFPNLDPEEQYQLRLKEVRKEFNAYRAKRREHCLKRRIEIADDPVSGDARCGFVRCGDIDCPFCGPYDLNKLRDNIQNHLEEGRKLRLVTLQNENERNKFSRKFKEHKTFVVEDEDGNVTFRALVETEEEIGVPYIEVDKEQLRQWLKPVYGHNQSGKLFKKTKPVTSKEQPEVKEEEQKVSVSSEILYVDFEKCNEKTGQKKTSEEWGQYVIDLSIWRTKELNPDNLENLRKDLRKRREVRQEILAEIGAVVFDVEYRRRVIDINCVDWSLSLARVQKAIDTGRLKT